MSVLGEMDRCAVPDCGACALLLATAPAAGEMRLDWVARLRRDLRPVMVERALWDQRGRPSAVCRGCGRIAQVGPPCMTCGAFASQEGVA